MSVESATVVRSIAFSAETLTFSITSVLPLSQNLQKKRRHKLFCSGLAKKSRWKLHMLKVSSRWNLQTSYLEASESVCLQNHKIIVWFSSTKTSTKTDKGKLTGNLNRDTHIRWLSSENQFINVSNHQRSLHVSIKTKNAKKRELFFYFFPEASLPKSAKSFFTLVTFVPGDIKKIALIPLTYPATVCAR